MSSTATSMLFPCSNDIQTPYSFLIVFRIAFPDCRFADLLPIILDGGMEGRSADTLAAPLTIFIMILICMTVILLVDCIFQFERVK